MFPRPTSIYERYYCVLFHFLFKNAFSTPPDRESFGRQLLLPLSAEAFVETDTKSIIFFPGQLFKVEWLEKSLKLLFLANKKALKVFTIVACGEKTIQLGPDCVVWMSLCDSG